MHALLHYGSGASLSLELPEEAVVAVCDAPRGVPLADVAAATDRALAEPLEFPPLTRTALPGDRVVLAIEPSVPRVATIVARTVAALLSAQVLAADIHILCATADGDDPLGELPADVRSQVTTALHDPHNRDALSYLAASSDAKPIYLNRLIHDADLVVSIGCLRLEDAPGYYGLNAGLYSAFSDAATIARYRSSKSDEPPHRKRLARQADEASWLLGARFMIDVVPGAGNDVLHVLAGEGGAVARRGRELCAAAWHYEVKSRAGLVVATIAGDQRAQTWENVGRALAAASRARVPGGAIVIGSELATAPGPALRRLASTEDFDDAQLDLDEGHPADALAARQLSAALEQGSVYLMSRLDADVVEELGLVPLAADDVSRLARRFDSCLVLGNAHFALGEPEATVAAPAKRRTKRSAK